MNLEVIQRTKQCGNHHGADQQMEEDAECVHLNASAEGGEYAKAKLIDTEQPEAVAPAMASQPSGLRLVAASAPPRSA